MIAIEFKVPLEVTTAYGDGYIWYMMDYGAHADTLYTIIIKESGECWQMSHKDFRVKSNTSLGIRKQYPGLEKVNGHIKPVNGHSVPQ
ncbi:MAG: hypothetical protein JWR72_2510 [Flavisolibacter sp.]|nr:hypothetical protein [Flavisolibacter sp.]